MPALLQVVQDTLAGASAAVADTLIAPPPEPTFMEKLGNGFELLFLGGWTMIPILFLSIVTVAIFWERLRALRRAEGDPQTLTQSVGD